MHFGDLLVVIGVMIAMGVGGRKKAAHYLKSKFGAVFQGGNIRSLIRLNRFNEVMAYLAIYWSGSVGENTCPCCTDHPPDPPQPLWKFFAMSEYFKVRVKAAFFVCQWLAINEMMVKMHTRFAAAMPPRI